MREKTMEEQAEQLVAFEAWDQTTPVAFETDFKAGWDAGVAWARAQERQRLTGCHHANPCRSAEACYLTIE